MRRLHIVRPEEHFVASGRYAPVSGGLPTEAWTLHRLAEAWFVRVDRIEADQFILGEALLEASFRPLRFNEEHFNATGRTERHNHVFLDGLIQTSHTQRHQPVTVTDRPLADESLPILWPLLLRGLACHALLEQPQWSGERLDSPGQQLRPVVIAQETWLTSQRSSTVQEIQLGTDRLWLASDGIAHKIKLMDTHEFSLHTSTAL